MGTVLRDTWRERAQAWIEWSRDPGLDDDFWEYHLPAFMDLVPSPDGLTLDLGCGEGRVTRELRSRGHHVIGVDAAEVLVRAAALHPQPVAAVVGDAASLPLPDGAVSRVVAFMCLHDMDDLPSVITEVRRVLSPDGVFAIALLHPALSGMAAGSYMAQGQFDMEVSRRGRTMRYSGRHRPLQDYFKLVRDAGLAVKDLREVADPRSQPAPVRFLHLLVQATP